MKIQAMTGHSKYAGRYSRGYLPHFDGEQIPQMITFRLFDSLPKQCLDEWDEELRSMNHKAAERERQLRIEEYLDKGAGSAWLSRPDLATITATAILHFEPHRYQLHAWVVMPTHVHVLLTPASGERLGQIIHSWKSFTANKSNKILGRKGSFWQREFFDRYIRDEQHFAEAVRYIEDNPVKAGLCRTASEWPYSSASPFVIQIT